jgi:hypothetical protein
MRHNERGAALIETALALPVILFALYGASWAIRQGAVSERAEAAVRYAGVISAQQNPYHDYSLYGLYNNLGTTSNVQTSKCTAPNGLLITGGTFPVVIPGTQKNQQLTPSFWQPDFAPVASCASTPVRQLFTGGTRSYLLLQNVPTMGTLVSDGGYFGLTQFGAATQTAYKFYRSPDMATLMHCAQTLSTAVSGSLAPLKYGTAPPKLMPLQAQDFNSSPFAMSPNCTTGIGTQPIAPTPQPTTFAPGTTAPTATPGPLQSPTAQPSPNPTKTPATPAPSATPTAAASPTPASSPTGGGGGGGGGGNGSPTPTPSPGNGGSPAPIGSPSGAPTGKPTASPVPTVSPATPKPTTSPTTSPTKKPAPSPSPSQPPGTVS